MALKAEEIAETTTFSVILPVKTWAGVPDTSTPACLNPLLASVGCTAYYPESSADTRHCQPE